MKQQASVLIALYAYGGNGGTSSLIPEMAVWLAKAYHFLLADPRISQVHIEVYSDTPIYMTRNRTIRDAKRSGFDFILMLDSDNEPDAYYGREEGAKAFLREPFDFAFDRLCKGLPTFIAAPYCGPPPHPLPKDGVTDMGEVPYLFSLSNTESGSDAWKIALLTREHAAILKGIQPVPCLPTGVSLSSTSVWDGPPKPYFDYEHDEEKTVKNSTEDCYATRNLTLYWQMTKGIDVCFAACDSWALHHKPKRVGKPLMPVKEQIASNMIETILKDRSGLVEHRHVNFELDTALLPKRGQTLTHDQDYIVLSDEDLAEARFIVEREKAKLTSTTAIEKMRSAVDADYITCANDGREYACHE